MKCLGCDKDARPYTKYHKPKYCSRRCMNKAAVRRWREAHPTAERKPRSWDKYLRSNYGIGAEDYEALVAEQCGRCAVCGRRPEKRLFVDHNHQTKRVRGLLCLQCNAMLGQSGDQPAILRAGADYLERG